MKDGCLKLADGRRVNQENMAALAEGAVGIVRRMGEAGVFLRSAEAHRIRACIWAGQAPDERIYGEDAFPFAGASDLRVRTADRLVRARVAEATTALLRAQPSFGTAQLSPDTARFLSEVWQGTMEKDLELEWQQQIALLSLYLWGGGRAMAGFWIGWDGATEWVRREYTLDEARAKAQEAGIDPTMFDMALADPDQMAELLKAVELVPASRAVSAAKEMLETGILKAAEARRARWKPRVQALELGVQLFVDPTTGVGRGDDAEAIHLVEWLSPMGLRSRALEEDWDEAYTKKLFEKGPTGSDAIFPEWDYALPQSLKPSRVEMQREAGNYQVVTSYVRAMGPDGIPGRWRIVWSPGIADAAARPADLVSTPWNGWPVMLFSAEVRGPGAMDGLGAALKMSGLQTQQKLTSDMIADLSMLQLPPVVEKGTGANGAGRGITIEPLALNQIGISEEVGFMTPPQLPQTSLAWLKEVRLMIAEAGDLPHEEIPAELTATLQEERIGLWLKQCSEAVRRVLLLVLSKMDPGTVGAYPELAEGAFPVRLRYNARAWDMEYMERLAKIMNQLLVPLDRTGRLNLGEFVATAVMDLLPTHAELLKPSDDDAARDEIADEERVYVRMRGGIRTPVPEGGGADYARRLDFYAQLEQDPDVYADLAPDKVALIDERKQALSFQLEQLRNAQIGRTGVEEAVPAPEAAEPGSAVV